MNDFQWKVDGDPNLPWIGVHRGKEEIRKFLRIFSDNLSFESFKIEQFITQGNNVIALGHSQFLVKKNHQRFEFDFVIHFQVREDKVALHNVYEDSYAVSSAFRTSA